MLIIGKQTLIEYSQLKPVTLVLWVTYNGQLWGLSTLNKRKFVKEIHHAWNQTQYPYDQLVACAGPRPLHH